MGFSSPSCKPMERLQLHKACRENLPYEKTITLRDDPMANKLCSHFLIQNKIQVLGLHWPSPAKGWRKVKCYKLQVSSMSSLLTAFESHRRPV